eukprot:TRINITY_DN257_c0_g1_i1.p1 TRINITY_DN257_c0_g1~~TRINITY_DN257_c0_g1_i1.p1  ORF type:complete len:350 (+),score=95.13 TRINITY_DN257_c0_g1_i1:48-1097(+)
MPEPIESPAQNGAENQKPAEEAKVVVDGTGQAEEVDTAQSCPKMTRWNKLKTKVVRPKPESFRHPRIYHPAKSKMEEQDRMQRLHEGCPETHKTEKHEPEGTRAKIVHFIHSRKVQMLLLAMLVFDVLVVIAELILPQFQVATLYEKPNLCAIDPTVDLSSDPHRRGFSALGSGNTAYGMHNASGYFPAPTCGVFGSCAMSHDVHEAEMVLAWISRVILMIFFVELMILVVCLGKKFFTVLFTLDLVVVTVSLAVSWWELYGNTGAMGLEILILLRLWRFARVLHGFGMVVHEHEEDKVHIIMDCVAEYVSEKDGADGLHDLMELIDKELIKKGHTTTPSPHPPEGAHS